MGFEGIIGQDRVKNILRLALRRSRVPNSLLFLGPEGVGKRMTAYTLARALNCLQGGDDPCERCPSCRAILAGMNDEAKGSPDVKEIRPGGEEEAPNEPPDRRNDETGKNSIKVKQVRYLKYFAYRKPMSSRKRIYIISDAERMTDNAKNAFLKVLEEPPPLTHFLLLSAYPDSIPHTIKSRCMTLNLGLIPREEVEKRLLDRGEDPVRARVLAFLSCGSLEKALEIDWQDVCQERREVWELLRSLLGREEAAGFLEEHGGQRRSERLTDSLERLWETAAVFLRDLLLIREGGDAGLLMNPDYEDDLRAAASTLSLKDIQSAQERVDRSLAGLDKSLNLNLLVSTFYSDIIDREP